MSGARPGVTLSCDELAVLCRLLGCGAVAGADPRRLGTREAVAALSALAARGFLRWDDGDGRPAVVGAVAATVRLAAEVQAAPAAGSCADPALAKRPKVTVAVTEGRFGTVRLEPLVASRVPSDGPEPDGPEPECSYLPQSRRSMSDQMASTSTCSSAASVPST